MIYATRDTTSSTQFLKMNLDDRSGQTQTSLYTEQLTEREDKKKSLPEHFEKEG